MRYWSGVESRQVLFRRLRPWDGVAAAHSPLPTKQDVERAAASGLQVLPRHQVMLHVIGNSIFQARERSVVADAL